MRMKKLLKRQGLLLLAVFSLLMVFESLAELTHSDYSVFQKVEAKTKKSKIYKKGELVKVGDVEYTLNSVSTATNIGGEWGENASGVFLIINVTITNKGSDPLTISDDYFSLTRGKKSYKVDSTAGIYANEDSDFFYSDLNPENSLTGNIVFDVTQEVISDTKLQMKVKTGFWGTQTARIYVNQ